MGSEDTDSDPRAHGVGEAQRPAPGRGKKVVFATLATVLALVVSVLAAELFVRLIAYGKIGTSKKKFRNPGTYATFDTDDYWKLRMRFEGIEPPKSTHPELGWVNGVDPATYRHHESKHIAGRTPVLLYGDSFAECVTDKCFEDLLNEDQGFSSSHFLLNHGVGGYGVGQIALFYEKTVGLYEKPVIVFSLMTMDMDRSVLAFRSSQKPFFAIRDGALELEGFPINPDQAQYLRDNPPRVKSFLWQVLIRNRGVPAELRRILIGKQKRIDYKLKLNRMILERVVRDLKARDVRFVFLVFHPHRKHKPLDGPDSWRDAFLKDFLESQEVPYIWSKDVVLRDAEESGRKLSEYFFAGDNHPTDLCNRLIAAEIKSAVLDNSS